MDNQHETKNIFFISIWIVFFILLIAYSFYLLIKSPDLSLILNPVTDEIVPYTAFRMILGLYFFIAVFNIKKIKNNKFWIWAVLGVGLVSRIILIPSTPVLEDDYYRYLWDGAVTAKGYNAYVYSPYDVMNQEDDNVPGELHKLAIESGDVIKNINHPHIRTIYPVLSQFVFAASYFVSPWNYWAWKIFLLIFDLLLLFVLFKTLNHLKLPLIFITFYWLNPIVIHEFFNAAHMDLLALLFVMIALYMHLKKNLWYAIISLAFAAAFKLWPVVLLPLLVRNLWTDKKLLLKYVGTFIGIVILLFIPVLISNLDESLGFIRYAGKWINNAAFYTIYQWLTQQIISLLQISVTCLSCINRWSLFIIYLIIVVSILRKAPKDNIQLINKALLIVAVLYLISPTEFPWYYTWMLPLLIIRPKVSLLLYPLLLPLYQLNYLADYIIYFEHIPILILFILELKGVIWKEHFSYVKSENGTITLTT